MKRIRNFIKDMTRLMESSGAHEALILEHARDLLAGLIAHDDWLPREFAQAHPDHYQQYLLYCDPLERFAVVRVVWGPGQRTQVHDHTVWGLIGLLRGAEKGEFLAPSDPGRPLIKTREFISRPGQIEAVSPQVGDVHSVANALESDTSVSIHVYGGNIGAISRHIYDPLTSEARTYVSGYSSDVMPNFWTSAG
jgi:predicted metal-dependent enzyme (double-stranded beta helix superfamily)